MPEWTGLHKFVQQSVSFGRFLSLESRLALWEIDKVFGIKRHSQLDLQAEYVDRVSMRGEMRLSISGPLMKLLSDCQNPLEITNTAIEERVPATFLRAYSPSAKPAAPA